MRVVETILESSARLHKNARESGLVHRAIHSEVPPRVDYGLTDLGTELLPVLNGLHAWGERQFSSADGDKPQSTM